MHPINAEAIQVMIDISDADRYFVECLSRIPRWHFKLEIFAYSEPITPHVYFTEHFLWINERANVEFKLISVDKRVPFTVSNLLLTACLAGNSSMNA